MSSALRARVRAVRRLVTVSVLVVFVEVALRLRVPLPTLCRLLGCPFVAGTSRSPDPLRPPRWARVELYTVNRVLARWPFGDTCLRRCLVAGHRLRSLAPVLVIGVSRRDGEFVAHSWLEVDGRALDPAAADFRPLTTRP